MRIGSSAVAVLLLTCSPAVVAGQVSASGFFAPAGPPERAPTRVDAGGACVVDLVQAYTVEGTLTGDLTLDYRILVMGPCGSPAGTFDEEWIARGTYSGTALGQEVTASVVYTADVREGGSVRGTIAVRGDVNAGLEITGAFADRRLSYNGTLELSRTEVPQTEQTPAPEEAEVRSTVESYYQAFSDRDWDRFAEHFWPGASLTTVWTPPGEESERVVATTIPDFIAQAPAGPGSRDIFEEWPTAMEIRVEHGLAQVWARYRARFGDPGEVMEWKGVDAFTLVRHGGEWRITSIAYVSTPE